MRGGWTGRRTMLLVAAVAVLAAGGAATVAGRRDVAAVLPLLASPAATLTPAPALGPSRPALLAALEPAGPPPTAAGITKALAAGLRAPELGGRVAISVLDTGTGQPLLEVAAGAAALPASTAKIATAVAVLASVPADRRLTTRALAGPRPGDVVLVGAGDPTLAGPYSRPGYPAVARLADLAAQVRTALAGAPVRRVLVDDSLYGGPLLGPGWSPQYVSSGDVAPVTALMVDSGRTALPAPVGPLTAPRHADPALAAGRSLAALLGAPGVPVERARAAAGATVLGAVSSPPMPALVEAMLTRSDNDLAEALARQVALARGQPATFAGVHTAMRAVLDRVLVTLGASAGSVQLADGSGLSRLDAVQPAALTRLLAAIAGKDRARFAPVLSGLPVAGFDGTLQNRYRSGGRQLAAGAVRGKTGTLNGVIALAGLVHARDGRLLAFDFTANSVPYGATLAAERALDRLAAALAGCGCR